jgi:hypothetical protein
MRAVQITRFGGPEVLDIVDVPEPKAGDGQKLYVSAAFLPREAIGTIGGTGVRPDAVEAPGDPARRQERTVLRAGVLAARGGDGAVTTRTEHSPPGESGHDSLWSRCVERGHWLAGSPDGRTHVQLVLRTADSGPAAVPDRARHRRRPGSLGRRVAYRAGGDRPGSQPPATSERLAPR